MYIIIYTKSIRTRDYQILRLEERCEELENERSAAAREYNERTAGMRTKGDFRQYDAWLKEHADELRLILLREERAECKHDELQRERGYTMYLSCPECLAAYCDGRTRELNISQKIPLDSGGVGLSQIAAGIAQTARLSVPLLV